jgi:hypothetical protein
MLLKSTEYLDFWIMNMRIGKTVRRNVDKINISNIDATIYSGRTRFSRIYTQKNEVANAYTATFFHMRLNAQKLAFSKVKMRFSKILPACEVTFYHMRFIFLIIVEFICILCRVQKDNWKIVPTFS